MSIFCHCFWSWLCCHCLVIHSQEICAGWKHSMRTGKLVRSYT
jgi:hypothetical protein